MPVFSVFITLYFIDVVICKHKRPSQKRLATATANIIPTNHDALFLDN